MEFYQVVGRRTVRDFTGKQVPLDVLERILDAGLKAPTHDHLRNWEFVVLRTKEEIDNALPFVKKYVETFDSGFLNLFPEDTSQRSMYNDAILKQYSQPYL